MVKINNALLLLSCILLLFGSCSGFYKLYGNPNSERNEGATDLGPILTFVSFRNTQKSVLPFSYLQPVLPLPYENYKIWLSVKNINDVLKSVAERKNKEYTEDIMRSMYFDEFRIVLPSGKIIDLLKRKIDVIYHYNGSEKETGILYKEVKNVKPQQINGARRLFFDGIKDSDGISIYFSAKIPAYSVNSIRLEYTLTVEWENRGTVKQRTILIFNKEIHKWYFFTV